MLAAILYPLYSLAYLAMLIWAIFLWFNRRSFALLVMFAILIGLLYDNTVITIGNLLGESALLQTLNAGRFFIHALVTPLLILAALDQAKRFDIKTAQTKWMQAVLGTLTLGLIIMGLAEFSNLTLEPETFMGTLRYANPESGPPIPAIITIFVLMGIGIAIWRRASWPWLFAGAIVMFVGSAIPPSVVGPIVGSGVEVILLISLLATEKQLQTTAVVADSPQTQPM